MTGVPYTRERLLEAAACCSDIEEVVAFFGTKPYGSLHRHLYKRFADFGIDVSHFRHVGRLTKRRTKPARDTLRTAAEDSISIAEILARLRRPDNSRQRAMLREWIAEERLSTTHLLGQAHQ